MTRFIPERPDIMNQMERDQRDARKGGAPEDEILQYEVDRYHPSFRELRTVRNSGTLLNYIPLNERMLVGDKVTRKEINLYNRKQRLVQEIGATQEDWVTVNGKTRRVWVYVLLIAKNVVTAARVRNRRMINGAEEKDKRLVERLQSPRRYRRQADGVRRSVEAAIRRGRRGR